MDTPNLIPSSEARANASNAASPEAERGWGDSTPFEVK